MNMKFFAAIAASLFLPSAAAMASKTTAKEPEPRETGPDQVAVNAGVADWEDLPCPILSCDVSNDPVCLERYLAAVKPCGHYTDIKCGFEVLPANVDFPGGGEMDLEEKPYIVQFDIGVDPAVRDRVLADLDAAEPDDDVTLECIGCDAPGETCLEIIVVGNSDASGGGCAGRCGGGCHDVGFGPVGIAGGGLGKDCMKHDACSTYKAAVLGLDLNDYNLGYCLDPDCGDEGAQAVMNCYIDRFYGDEWVVCDEWMFEADHIDVWGHWSASTALGPLFREGPCYNFRGWSAGQGIPNRDQIENPYDEETHFTVTGEAAVAE